MYMDMATGETVWESLLSHRITASVILSTGQTLNNLRHSVRVYV